MSAPGDDEPSAWDLDKDSLEEWVALALSRYAPDRNWEHITIKVAPVGTSHGALIATGLTCPANLPTLPADKAVIVFMDLADTRFMINDWRHAVAVAQAMQDAVPEPEIELWVAGTDEDGASRA